MSFFDEDDEPTRRTQVRSPRSRPAGPGSSRPASSGSSGTDSQTLLIRRAVAIGGALLFLILLFFVVRGCAAARTENALKDYNSEVGSIIRESDQQVVQPFFQLMSERDGESPDDLETEISSYRVAAERQLDQAQGLDVPDQMVNAHESVLVALEYRRDAVEGVANRIRTALGDRGEAADEAIAAITGDMQQFLASDVTWQARVVPLIKRELDEAEIGGQDIATTGGALPDLTWLQEETVAQRLGQQISGGEDGERGGDEEIRPGLHGTGIDSVQAGDLTLQPETPNRIPAGTDRFLVRFTNQGENDEFDVRVILTVRPPEGSGGRAIRAERTVDEVVRGATAEASLRLPSRPRAGQAVTIEVQVRPVPGEEKTDNNERSYPALFEG